MIRPGGRCPFLRSLLAALAVALAVPVAPPTTAQAQETAQPCTASSSYAEVGGYPSPASGHIGQIESNDLAVASLRWMGDLFPRLTACQPELIDYLVDRVVGPLSGQPGADVSDAFVMELINALGGGGRDVDEVRTLAVSVRDAVSRLNYARVQTLPRVEFEQQVTSVDLPGKRARLETALRTLLVSLGPLTAANARWGQLLNYLKTDLAAALQRTTAARDDDLSLLDEMNRAFFYATPRSARSKELYEQATALRRQVEQTKKDLMYGAFGPGATPGSFAREGLGRYIDLQVRYDDLVASGYAELQADRVEALVFNAVLDDKKATARRDAFRKQGRPAYILDLLIDLADSYRAARIYKRAGSGYFRPPESDRYRSEATLQRLRAYRDEWIAGRAGPLLALADVDARGERIWQLGGWLKWEWPSTARVTELTDLGRVVRWQGRRFVVPPGTQSLDATRIAALKARNQVRELIVALDPASLSFSAAPAATQPPPRPAGRGATRPRTP